VTSFRQSNDAKHGRRRPPPHARGGAPRKGLEDGAEWLWGWHAVVAALENPARERPKLLLATPDRAKQLTGRFGKIAALEISDNGAIAGRAPQGAVHQGVLLKTAPLESLSIEDLAHPASGLLVMLDQVTDPQNVGAIYRSAAAFGARGIIVQDRHAPNMTGALAKAAAGAVDKLPHARVTNLSRALETLAEAGWRTVGLAGGASVPLGDAFESGPTVLVLGSEGEGLRRLVSEHCDVLAKIPMPGGFESLNVSAAAAVALYEATRKP
jgi:23S rRNA (guanosine2251-2'-O)-methyltransferase